MTMAMKVLVIAVVLVLLTALAAMGVRAIRSEAAPNRRFKAALGLMVVAWLAGVVLGVCGNSIVGAG